jgi:hypothetical protein
MQCKSLAEAEQYLQLMLDAQLMHNTKKLIATGASAEEIVEAVEFGISWNANALKDAMQRLYKDCLATPDFFTAEAEQHLTKLLQAHAPNESVN